MALLLKKLKRKVKGATLIEVLVASVLIVVVFSMASLALNTVFRSVVKNSNAEIITTRMNELAYLYQHQKIRMNYQETYNDWNISLSKQRDNNQSVIRIEAVEKSSEKKIVKKCIDARIE